MSTQSFLKLLEDDFSLKPLKITRNFLMSTMGMSKRISELMLKDISKIVDERIKENLQRNIDIATIANSIGMTKDGLYKKLRRDNVSFILL